MSKPAEKKNDKPEIENTEPAEWPESRADAIGQNGNDGEHYGVIANDEQ